MAHKLTLSALLLLALIAVAAANTYTTTTITTAVDEDSNQGRQQQQCRQQIQGRRFQNCERYLSQRGGYFGREDDEMNQGREQEQSLRQCCQELRNVDEQCQCEAVRHVAQRAQQEQRGGREWEQRRGQESERRGSREWEERRGQESERRGGESEQVYQRARELPRQCNLRERECRFRLVFV